MKKFLAILLSLVTILSFNAETLACTTSGTSGNCTTTTTTTTTTSTYIYKSTTTATTKTVKACTGTVATGGGYANQKATCGTGTRCGCNGENICSYYVNVKFGGITYKYRFNTYRKTCQLVSVVTKSAKCITVPRTVKWRGVTYQVNGTVKKALSGCTKVQSIKYYAQISSFTLYLRYCTRLDEIIVCTNKVKSFTKDALTGIRKYCYIDCCSTTQWYSAMKIISYRKDLSIVYGGKYARYGKGVSGSGSCQSKVGANATVKCGNYSAHCKCKCSCYK